MAKAKTDRADAVIVGGGFVGLATGIALAEAGLAATVIDRVAPPPRLAPGFDGRASAIAHASVRLLEALGVWRHVADHQPILEIRVSDRHAPVFLHFDCGELDGRPLGEMVENRHLLAALHARAGELQGLRLLAPAEITDVVRSAGRVEVALADGRRIRAPLLVAADGRRSRLRRLAGIRHFGWDYGQEGIVTTIHHELDHGGIAHERFLSGGPFAILPLTGRRSSLVWTLPARLAPAAIALPEPAFTAAIARRIGGFLGAIRVADHRFRYPLNLVLAERFVAERLVLVGDAAHGIHPIAGQGLNLGLRDVAALAEVLVEAARRGEDIGAPGVLGRYERWRRTDSLVLATVTDGLNRLFATDCPPVALARDAGLAAVERMPPLKRFFMRHARGTLGRLPRLLEGRSLQDAG